jgi:hypothetical protein
MIFEDSPDDGIIYPFPIIPGAKQRRYKLRGWFVAAILIIGAAWLTGCMATQEMAYPAASGIEPGFAMWCLDHPHEGTCP